MLMKTLFAVVPMIMVAGSVIADDDMLSTIANLTGGSDAVQSDDTETLGQADVDALLGEDNESGEEAIAACFRRIGYGNHYGSYSGYRGYSSCHSYNSWYSPVRYSYGYSTFRHYTPVRHTYCAPVTYSYYTPSYSSYWGCY